MKRLIDLTPKWTGLLRPNSGEGLTLECPACGPAHTLAVYFSNPVDGKPPAIWLKPSEIWLRENDAFENLTVAPSIQYPCFHGWIEGGNVIDISESPATVLMVIAGKETLVALSPQQFAAMSKS